jgi:hypothetical protein
MAYMPELSRKHSCTLRRIAWAMDMPMKKAIEEVFDYLRDHLDHGRVCGKCRDKSKCDGCVFNRNRNTQH